MNQVIDILIPLGLGSCQNDLELKYCLRSVEKHLTGVGNVFIVGEKPGFLKNVCHIPCEDSHGIRQKDHNIYRKIIKGCGSVSDNFLFLNDDHFLLTGFEASKFPYLHRGPVDLDNYIGNPPQRIKMANTINHFDGSAVYDFDIHCPVVMNKVNFCALPEGVWPEYGYGIKSLYCNIYATDSLYSPDLKFREALNKEIIYKALEGRQWFSTGDDCLRSGAMKLVLQELYPDKSKYEI